MVEGLGLRAFGFMVQSLGIRVRGLGLQGLGLLGSWFRGFGASGRLDF